MSKQAVPFVPPVLTDQTVGKFVQRHVCSRCYGHLNKYPGPRQATWVVKCSECGSAWGYTVIKRSTARRREQDSLTDKLDLFATAPDLVGPRPPVAQIMKELGF